MSTRSVIAIQRDKDKYECIYCHSDGYLTYNGAMLLDNYNERKKVEALIKLGDISCLCEKLEPDPSKPHSFDYGNRQDDVTVAYGRDRGDENVQSRLLSYEEMIDWGMICYFYIYDLDGKWKYTEYPYKEIKEVEEDLKAEYENMGIKRPEGYYGYWTEESIKEEKEKQKEAEQQ